MEDATMPGCSNVEQDPLDMDNCLAYFDQSNPTLIFDEYAQPETGYDHGMVDTTLEHDENQLDADWDWNTENTIMQENNAYGYDNNNPGMDFTNGAEDGNSDYVGGGGGMDNEFETNVVVPFSVWPPVPTPFNCSYCHVLREIIHENGAVSMKLEIHGRIGIICHAIHERRTEVIDGPPVVNHEMVDFATQSMESVKQFLTRYCQNRTQEGFVLLQDPLSVYYNALCSGLDWFNNSDSDESNLPPGNPEAHHTRAEEANGTPANTNVARNPRPDLAVQRRRSKEFTLQGVARYFDVPIVCAADKLEICSTVLKKKCRKFGVRRWPFRTVKSIKRRISILEAEGNSDRSELEVLRAELTEILAGRGKPRMPVMT